MKVCYSRILCQERIREVRAMTIREEIEQLKKEKKACLSPSVLPVGRCYGWHRKMP